MKLYDKAKIVIAFHMFYTGFTARHKTLHIENKDQLSLTNPRDALHHGERAANK